ncbi:hypothetical protein BY996DRAFT_6558308 [Phakopsora pachyrhizi]|nr:hypothetical protein BY996DRAFT_6558308 [Phakopsora pachyrhizi]
MNKNKLKTRLPLLHQHNFFLILGNHSDLPTRDEKGKFVNLSDILKEKLDLAHSIIITHIDDSLLTGQSYQTLVQHHQVWQFKQTIECL